MNKLTAIITMLLISLASCDGESTSNEAAPAQKVNPTLQELIQKNKETRLQHKKASTKYFSQNKNKVISQIQFLIKSGKYPEALIETNKYMHTQNKKIIELNEKVNFLINGWKLMGGVYKRESGINFVLINNKKILSEEVYINAITQVCRTGSWCQVRFWDKENLMQKGTPRNALMTESQVAAMIATFTRNPYTNLERLLYSCKIVSDPNRCF